VFLTGFTANLNGSDDQKVTATVGASRIPFDRVRAALRAREERRLFDEELLNDLKDGEGDLPPPVPIDNGNGDDEARLLANELLAVLNDGFEVPPYVHAEEARFGDELFAQIRHELKELNAQLEQGNCSYFV
jgi:hypothetical protein